MGRFLVIVLLNMWALFAIAEQLDVYRVETRVANQTEAERITAAKSSLGDIIVRVTGDATALQHPLVQQAIAEARNYLVQFSYSSVSDSKFSSDAKPTDVKLILNYSPQAIEKLLRSAQLLQKPLQQKIIIQISNVQNFTAFKQAQANLKTTSAIRRSDLVSTNKDVLIFDVLPSGDIATLKSALEGNAKWQVFEPAMSDAQTNPDQPLQLNLRWRDE